MSSSKTITRAFVTGASGFVGRNLIRALYAAGVREFRALVRSQKAAAQLPTDVPGIVPVLGDVKDLEAIRAGMEGCSHVFHLAAMGFGEYKDLYAINVVWTRQLLTIARAVGVKRFVHCSTDGVLCGGKRVVKMADEKWPLPETPKWASYSRSKGEGEREVLAANCAEFETVIIRPRYIWGRDDTVVLGILTNMVATNTFIWFDHGRYLTSTCHIRNACEGAVLAATEGPGGEIYFLTDGAPIEMRKMWSQQLATQGIAKLPNRNIPCTVAFALAFFLEWIWWFAGLFCKVTSVPPITRQVIRLLGREITVDDRKARAMLGYKGRVTFEEGLKEMSDDFLATRTAAAPRSLSS